MQVCASLTPGAEDARRLPDPTIFQKHNPAMFERFKVPIAGASFIKKLFKSRKGQQVEDTDGHDGQKDEEAQEASEAPGKGSRGRGRGRGRGKAKAKAKAKSKAGVLDDLEEQKEKDEMMSDVKMDMADSRPRWWLDDLIGCLVHAARRALT